MFSFTIHQFTMLFLSTDQTLSRLGLSELLVVMTKYDLDVNIKASESGDKFMERRVCGPGTCHNHMALG